MRSELILISLVLLSLKAQAQSAEGAGRTLMARGAVTATAQDSGQSRALQRRAPVFQVDKVATGADSQAQFRMSDGALLALKGDTELHIAEYRQGAAGEQGSVAMELIKGSLRTVTGSIKGEAGSYQLKTPVGSIGVRGTTFEVAYIGDILLVGVWDGSIELQVTNSETGVVSNVSFGQGQAASFASVSKTGAVTALSSPPAAFSGGGSQSSASGTSGSGNAGTASPGAGNSAGSGSGSGSSDSGVSELAELAYQGNLTPLSELIANRSGSFTYSQLQNAQVQSSQGAVSNFQVSMTIDFDNGLVPQGQLSFDDSAGPWFAAFNGVINVDQLELGVNFASHADHLAQGQIDAFFVDGTNNVLGQFTLSEINNSSATAGGVFLLK